jgi:crossover junction endodeoxyribonuclease RusA
VSNLPAAIRLDIPLGDHRWLTANQRMHHYTRASLVKAWRGYTCTLATRAGLPPIEKARVVCYLHFHDRRRRDPANFYPTVKACVDGLVDAGVFEDDDYTRVQGPDMRIGEVRPRGERGIVIYIYPKETFDD